MRVYLSRHDAKLVRHAVQAVADELLEEIATDASSKRAALLRGYHDRLMTISHRITVELAAEAPRLP